MFGIPQWKDKIQCEWGEVETKKVWRVKAVLQDSSKQIERTWTVMVERSIHKAISEV